jgi:hypothetical protein
MDGHWPIGPFLAFMVFAEECANAFRLSRVKPTTLAGAAALIEYVNADFKHSSPMDWQITALATAGAALKVMEARA